ncbi:hypothetical protein COP1_005999 [Malus domestica]
MISLSTFKISNKFKVLRVSVFKVPIFLLESLTLFATSVTRNVVFSFGSKPHLFIAAINSAVFGFSSLSNSSLKSSTYRVLRGARHRRRNRQPLLLPIDLDALIPGLGSEHNPTAGS